MQVVEYTLDDQPIILNKCELVSLIFINCCSSKKGGDQPLNSEQVSDSFVNLH